MSNLEESITNIEKYIKHLQKQYGVTAMMPVISKNKKYNEQKVNTPYYEYIFSANYSYFVARLLFMNRLVAYAFYCGFMCIENYLKAILKYNNENFSDKDHKISNLLEKCKNVMPQEKFLASSELKTILLKFKPYIEIPRYPIYKYGPEKGIYGYCWPDDIKILDYFVFEMKKIIIPPSDNRSRWEIEINYCKEKYPNFYRTFEENNINFIK